jgi:Curli assembly protein CsgE
MKSWIFLIFVLVFSSVNAQFNEHVIGKINLLEADNLLTVEAHVENEEPIFKDELFYTLLALKRNVQGNYSSNRQSGDFSLKPHELKNLSQIKLNIEKGEELKIFLFVKHKEVLVSKDSIFILASNKKNYEKEVEEANGFELKGIVIESVITKVGKDFHDYFYQAYLVSGNKHPFIINIKEKPYFGYSSIISIEVDDTLIYEFFSKPDEDYLRSSVNSALQKINQYAKQRKMLFKNSRI